MKLAWPASVEDCSLAFGEIIGHGNILSAARMSAKCFGSGTVKESAGDELTGACENTPNSTSSVADVENVLDNVDEERSSFNGNRGESLQSTAKEKEISERMSGFSNDTCTVEDMKSFLMKTKHARHVRIDDPFPNVKMFIEKNKLFAGESCFTDQERYRLKTILT